jgi:uncharacterized Zn-finger protein
MCKNTTYCNERPENSDVQYFEDVALGIQPKLCDICGRDFAEARNAYQSNISAFAGSSGSVITTNKSASTECALCFKDFETVENLFAHSVVHTLEERFQCPVCQMQFQHPSLLTNHLSNIHNLLCDPATMHADRPISARQHNADLGDDGPPPLEWISDARPALFDGVHQSAL